MKKLSAYRCFETVFVFLIAETLNTGFYPAGKATWLAAALGIVPALMLYKAMISICKNAQKGFVYNVVSALMICYSSLTAAELLGRLSLFITTGCDFVSSPHFISALAAVTGVYLACLRRQGFEKTVDTGFAWSAVLLGVYFISGFGVWEPGRLLPLFSENTGAGGFFCTFVFAFGRGFAAIWYLRNRADHRELEKGALGAAAAAGAVMAFSGVKNICTAGFELVSKYHFPVYAVCGVQYLWSYGLHIEDALVCAFMTMQVIKIAMCFRICAENAGELTGLKNTRAAAAFFGVLSLIWGLFSFSEGGRPESILLPDIKATLFICIIAPLFMSKPLLFWGGNTKTGKNDNMSS